MQEPSVVVAVISLCGTLFGSVTGVLVSNKLSTFRIEQLEKKIDKYATNLDDIKERLVIVEQSTKSAHLRLDGLINQLDVTDKRK